MQSFTVRKYNWLKVRLTEIKMVFFVKKGLNLDDTKSLSLRNEAPIFPKIQISPCNACFDSSVFHNFSNATLAEQKHNSCILSLQYR